MSIVDWANEPDRNALLEAIYKMEVDPINAKPMFEVLAEKGSPTSMYRLGEIYKRGLAGEADFLEAERWYQLAVKNGSLLAWYSLGGMYLTMSKFVQAKEAFEIAAIQGYAPALNQLGRCYASGVGTEVDLAKAKKFLKRASEKGHVQALGALGKIYRTYPDNIFDRFRGIGLYVLALFKTYYVVVTNGFRSERLR
ncbi:MAG: tetratricopeptide repeat protein [Parvibaculaceae bacterium]